MLVVKICILLLMVLLVSLISTSAFAQRPSMQGLMIDQPPKIDGVLDDVCWQKAPQTSDFHYRTDGTKATEDTTAWICYDSGNIYAAFYCKDKEPEKLKSQQKKRGGNMGTDDWVSLNLDCFNNAERIVWFQVSAGGVQNEDLQSGDVSKIEWRGDWYAKAKRVADGYIVEMQIPFSILKYDSSANCMGVAFSRQCAKLDQRWYSPDVGPNTDARLYYLWSGIKLPKYKSKPLIMGYSLLGAGNSDSPRKFGLDVKQAITPNFTGVLTLNPDFKSIEKQLNSVDFTYSEQWIDDGRPFFQEGSQYYPGSDIFYTIRIEDIDFGAKASGRYGNYNMGFMQAGKFEGNNYTATKISRSWTGKAYMELSGARSSVAGVDKLAGVFSGSYRLYDKKDQVISAYTNYSSADNNDSDRTGEKLAFGINSYGRPRVLRWGISRRILDQDYLPSLGYIPENGIRAWNMNVSIYDRPTKGNTNYWRANVYMDLADHSDGTLFYNNLGLYTRCNWINGTGISFSIAGSKRPPNQDRQVRAGFWWGGKTLYRGGDVSIGIGKIAGGDYTNYSAGQGWDITDKLSVYSSYEYSRIKPPSPDAYSLSQIVTSLNYDLSNEKSISGRIVNLSGKTNIYFSYRQRVRSGLDAYLIFGDPNAETTKTSVMLKVLRPI